MCGVAICKKSCGHWLSDDRIMEPCDEHPNCSRIWHIPTAPKTPGPCPDCIFSRSADMLESAPQHELRRSRQHIPSEVAQQYHGPALQPARPLTEAELQRLDQPQPKFQSLLNARRQGPPPEELHRALHRVQSFQTLRDANLQHLMPKAEPSGRSNDGSYDCAGDVRERSSRAIVGVGNGAESAAREPSISLSFSDRSQASSPRQKGVVYDQNAKPLPSGTVGRSGAQTEQEGLLKFATGERSRTQPGQSDEEIVDKWQALGARIYQWAEKTQQ